MKRRILYVLLFTLLYHIGYRPAFAAEMGHGVRKSPIATVGYKDKSAYSDSREYILIDSDTLFNEQEDEEETIPASRLSFTSRWAFYHYTPATPLVGRSGTSSCYPATARNKEKYIFIRVFKV